MGRVGSHCHPYFRVLKRVNHIAYRLELLEDYEVN